MLELRGKHSPTRGEPETQSCECQQTNRRWFGNLLTEAQVVVRERVNRVRVVGNGIQSDGVDHLSPQRARIVEVERVDVLVAVSHRREVAGRPGVVPEGTIREEEHFGASGRCSSVELSGELHAIDLAGPAANYNATRAVEEGVCTCWKRPRRRATRPT